MINITGMITYISNANSNERTISDGNMFITYIYDSPIYDIHFLPIAITGIITVMLGIVIYLLAVNKDKHAKIWGSITYSILTIISLISLKIISTIIFLLAIGMFIGNKNSKT
jgi:uncharacterized membrane protein